MSKKASKRTKKSADSFDLITPVNFKTVAQLRLEERTLCHVEIKRMGDSWHLSCYHEYSDRCLQSIGVGKMPSFLWAWRFAAAHCKELATDLPLKVIPISNP